MVKKYDEGLPEEVQCGDITTTGDQNKCVESTADQNSFYSLLLFLETCTGPSPMNASCKVQTRIHLETSPSEAV